MADEHVATELTHPRLPSSEAFVLINDQRVNVYDIKYEGENKVVGYIEAQESQEFEIGYKYVPGVLYGGSTAFSIVSRVDGIGEDFHKNVGSIQMQLRRLEPFQVDDKVAKDYKPGFQKEILHEASKKATLSHQVELGLSKHNVNTKTMCHPTFIDSRYASPYVQFEFRYMSRFLLEIGGHLPAHLMPASPSPARADAPTVDLTLDSDGEQASAAEEIQRLKRRLAELEGGQPQPDKKPKIECQDGTRTKGKKLDTVILD
ncbi:hypothetical protein OIO90_004432 [Microbotryomycetes sp. JL221]|nr:hypothetical protein OIO90_004432 [Microbotryomycetes sp. JL221]